MPETSFGDIPKRIFLDSSTLQTLQDYGAFLYENEPVSHVNRITRDKQGMQKLEALQRIMRLAERAPFQFAMSQNTIDEVSRAKSEAYLRWAHEVMAYWFVCLSESSDPGPSPAAVKLGLTFFDYLGDGDRALLRDALIFKCDTFLTMENKLPKNSAHLARELGIRVVSPVGMWEMLAPWASLFC